MYSERSIGRGQKTVLAVLTALTLVVFVLSAGAQTGQSEKVDQEMMKKIRSEGMERSQVMDTLSWLTDVVGYRLTGSPNMKKANEWTRAKLAEWGLVNAAVEPWGSFGRGWSFDRVSAHVVEPTPFPLIAYPEAWTPGTSGPVTAEIVQVNIQTEADLEKYKGQLKGKVVMSAPLREVKAWFNPPGERMTDADLLKMANDVPPSGGAGRQMSPEQMQAMRARMALTPKVNAFLLAEGAIAQLKVARVGDGGTVFVQGGGSREKDGPPSIPSLQVTVEHYNRISRILAKGIPVKVELNIKAGFHDEDLSASNTVAEIPGTDLKGELVMLGGHLDSWHGGTGATDNAAGVSVAMEAVRILKALGVQPRRTIRIALWSGEEQGLLGSRGYVRQHFAERQPSPQQQQQRDEVGRLMASMNPLGPLVTKPDHEKLSVYFNLDNGTGKIRGVYLQGNEAVRPIFRAWLAPFHDLGAATLTIQNTGGTDHLAFDAVGLPGFQFIQDPIEYDTRTHHSNMDTYERLQSDDMKQAAVIMAAFVYNAAMRDEKLPRKPTR
ncbi:MAG: M20/M25/M40 family metallo-hydrolase [Acidobacteria bacterium]|nr:M20/M25/M40 family metallo-hydrolase [Acidobacteriota bacterium]